MSRIFAAAAFLACLMIVVTQAQSQDGGKGQKGPMNRNGGPPPGGQGGPGGFGMNPQELMQRLAALDTNGDGALTSNEVTDPGLLGLMQRADTNGDGSVTQAEVEAVLSGQGGQQNGGGNMMGPPPGMNGMKPPRPGEILPEFMQQQLQMTAEQKQQLAVLQQQVDAQLKQILTAEQIALLQSAAPPGGPGGFGAGAAVSGTTGRGQKGQNGLNAAGAKGRKNRQQ